MTDHVTLTLDGTVPAIPPRRPGEMRWVPPELAAAIRADLNARRQGRGEGRANRRKTATA